MRVPRVLAFAAALVALTTAVPRAEGGSWADLARRIAATDPAAQLQVTLGAEPPGFVYPLPERPALRVRGSTWVTSKTDGPPGLAHVYYAASANTEAAARELFAALVAAGYTPATPGDVQYGADGRTKTQVYCKAGPRAAEVDVALETIAGLPAMDVTFSSQSAASLACRLYAFGWKDAPPAPSFADIPGVKVSAHLMGIGGVRNSVQTTSTVSTSLAAPEAVGRIAARFTSSGWSARPALATGDMITQRFSRADGPHRWDALIVLDRIADGRYWLVFDLEGSTEPAGG